MFPKSKLLRILKNLMLIISDHCLTFDSEICFFEQIEANLFDILEGGYEKSLQNKILICLRTFLFIKLVKTYDLKSD